MMNTQPLMLSILDDTTEFSSVLQFNIGKKILSERYFKTILSTPYQVEMAIIEIEDAIATIEKDWHKLIEKTNFSVVISRQLFSDVLDFSHAKDHLTTTQLEFAFNRLADVISGSPKRINEFPESAEFVSTMLILREIMHHLAISKVEVCE